MKRALIVKLIIVLTLFITWLAFALSKGFLYPDKGIKRENPRYDFTRAFNVNKKRNELSGINLGSALQVESEGDWGLVLKESDFEDVNKAGFKHVRIPVYFLPHIKNVKGKLEIDKKLLERLDWIIENCLSRDLIVIIESHYMVPGSVYKFKDDKQKNDTEKKFLRIWETLSKRYKNYNKDLWFELANEPHRPIGPKLWNTYIQKSLAVIRGSGGLNSERNVIVGVNILIGRIINYRDYVNGIKYLELPKVEDDPNIIVSFHCYYPIPFTYQGEYYSEDLGSISHFWLGNTWTNTERQQNYIRKKFDVISKWAKENKRQVMLGEFGSTLYADLESQISWTKFVKKEAETRDMIWFYWQLHDVSTLGGLYNQKERYWKKEIIDVLQPNNGLDSSVAKEGIKKLIVGLKDPEWKVRKKAAGKLKDYAPLGEEAIPYLIHSLTDEEWQVRNIAIQALGRYGEAATESIPYLIEFLEDEEWQLRNSATISLMQLGEKSKPALKKFIENLSHEVWVLRSSSAKVLSIFGYEARDSIPDLIENSKHETWMVRKAVLASMSIIDPDNPEVKDCIKKALNDPNYQVRNSAKILLKRVR